MMPTGNGIEWGEWARLTTSVWRIPAIVDLSIHPAMMPLEVARRCVALWSDVDGKVIDMFAGSGTTLVACVMMNRRFVGIERDSRYFDLACKRVEKAYQDQSLLSIMETVSPK